MTKACYQLIASKNKKIVFFLFVILFFNNSAISSEVFFEDDPDIKAVLKEYNSQGTMIISSLNQEVTWIYNQKRANERLSPASTFKIANSLIAVEEGVLKDQYEIIKWNGKKHFLDAWNQDQSLKSAFKSSCIWFYQELAKKIGKERYVHYLKNFNYGNHLLGDEVTTFWLENGGDLKITPLEQIDFLQRLYQKQLSLSYRSYDILQDIMLEGNNDNYKIYSKTGAATKNWIGHGWYIGYITMNDQVWFFVTNILIDSIKDLSKRKNITIDVLRKKGLI